MKLHTDLVSNLSIHGIHLLSSTSLHGKVHTQAHERLYLRLTSWGESRYFSVYGATPWSILEFGTFIVLCSWIYSILCKLLAGLWSLQLKIQYSLNVTNILGIVHHLRICQTRSFERVFVVIRYTDCLGSLERSSLIHFTLLWYFIIQSIHSASLQLSKCQVTQYTVMPKGQLTGYTLYRKISWKLFLWKLSLMRPSMFR